MDMTPESKFLKAGINIKDGDIIKFLDEGEEVDGQWGKKVQIKVETPNGEEKILTLNNSSRGNMVSYYGSSSDGWIGKEARINVVKMMVRGKMINVITLTEPNVDINGDVITQ